MNMAILMYMSTGIIITDTGTITNMR